MKVEQEGKLKKPRVLILSVTLLLVVAAAVTGFLLVKTSPVAAAPADFYGITSEGILLKGQSALSSEAASMSNSGVGIVRQTFDWAMIEPVKGQFDFEATDRLVESASSQQLRLLPILFNPPAWASSAPQRNAKKGVYPPKNPSDLADFATALVKRYGPDGSFWSSDNSGNKLPIKSWQVWNEPNLKAYWPTGPNARQYVRLLKPTYRAIKKADPRAEVVAAGLPESRQGTPFKTYAAGIYKAGGKAFFDTFSLHAYAVTEVGVVEAVRTTRALIKHFRDRAPIWVTEVGWATKAPGKSPFETTEKGQAKRVESLLSMLCRKRTVLGVRGVVYYSWRDVRPYSAKDFWGREPGLHRECL